jgi:hypothetical protein
MGVDWMWDVDFSSKKKVPEFVQNAPQTPLEEKVKGIIYPHLGICSGNRNKPIGSSGCCCLHVLRGRE